MQAHDQDGADAYRYENIMKSIEGLQCLRRMVDYYGQIHRSILHLLGVKNKYGVKDFSSPRLLLRTSYDQVREFRRYIRSDLEHYGLEFYLQRVKWALDCKACCGKESDPETCKAHRDLSWNQARHPCQMKTDAGFRAIIAEGDVKQYTYSMFLADTLPIFIAIHAHLLSINRALGDLYYYITKMPLATFTAAGKSEIRHLTSELNRVMRGLLVAMHLQPQEPWQADLVSYLLSCRTDCLRFFDTIPQYYQTHRLRLIVFPLGSYPTDVEADPNVEEARRTFPLACLPGSAGIYLDFLNTYQNIVKHTIAVINWAIRLYSLWYYVPRRVLRAVSPQHAS